MQELETEVEVIRTELSASLKLQAVHRLAERYYSSRYNQQSEHIRQLQIRKAFDAWSDRTTVTQVTLVHSFVICKRSCSHCGSVIPARTIYSHIVMVRLLRNQYMTNAYI
jgi:hypothetical protein